MVALLGCDRAGQTVKEQRNVLMNASQWRAQFVGNMRKKTVLEFDLLLAADFERAQQRLPLDRISHRSFQIAAGHVALDQIILHALVNRANPASYRNRMRKVADR